MDNPAPTALLIERGFVDGKNDKHSAADAKPQEISKFRRYLPQVKSIISNLISDWSGICQSRHLTRCWRQWQGI